MELAFLVVFAIVAVAFLVIGHKGKRHSTTVQGLFLMDGELEPRPFAATLAASNYSLGNMVYVSLIWGYLFGFSAILWLCLGFIVAAALYIFFLNHFSAFRSYIEDRKNSGSIHEYLEIRARRNPMDRNARRTRLAASFITIVGLLIALTLEIFLATLLFSLISEAHPTTIFVVLTALICVYSAHGGFWAVVYTDAVSGLMLILGVVLIGAIYFIVDLPYVSYSDSYGFEIFSVRGLLLAPGWVGISVIVITFVWYLTTMDTWQRASSSRSGETAKKGMITGTKWLVLGIIVFSSIGIWDRLAILPSLSQELAAVHSGGYNPLTDFFLLKDQLDGFWQWALGFIAVAFVVAGLSTADTFILICGHSFVSDVIVGYGKKATFGDLTDDENQLFAGFGQAIIAVMGLFVIVSYFVFQGIGILTTDNALNTFFVAYSIQFALLAPVLFSVWPQRPSSGVVLAAILASVVVGLFWGVGSAMSAASGGSAISAANEFLVVLKLSWNHMVYLTPLATIGIGVLILGVGRCAGWCVED